MGPITNSPSLNPQTTQGTPLLKQKSSSSSSGSGGGSIGGDIADIQDSSRALQMQEQAELDRLRAEFDNQYTNQKGFQENEIVTIKDKGEKEIHALRKALDSEYHRTRQTGEQDVNKIHEYYRKQAATQDRQEKEKFLDIENKAYIQEQLERKTAGEHIQHVQEQSEVRMENLNQQSEDLLKGLQDIHGAEYQRLQAGHSQALVTDQESFQENYQKYKDLHEEVLKTLNDKMNNRVEELQKDSLRKISKYEAQTHDPFYHPIEIETSFSQTDDAFILKAKIPKYEQEHISVMVHGNRLILAGYRQTQQEMKTDAGGTQASASYQSYNKTFPLNWPVDGKKLSREFKDDQLTVKLPKLTPS